jgi:hypothetical protein
MTGMCYVPSTICFGNCCFFRSFARYFDSFFKEAFLIINVNTGERVPTSGILVLHKL